MSHTDDDKLWARHMRDEARALEAQQVTAGSTHSPVERHASFTQAQLDAAVQAERERCAAAAERWSQADTLRAAFANFTGAQQEAAAAAARAVASDIRRAAEPHGQ